MRAADLGTFVPVEADPTHRAFELLDRLLRGALQVSVLYPQHERAAVLARVEPVEERRPHPTHMQPARRARRVPDPDLCLVLHKLNLTQVGLGRAVSCRLPANLGSLRDSLLS